MKHVIVTAEFVNLIPAHERYITKQGKGSTPSVAIRTAIANILIDRRLKGKRMVYPIKLVVQNCDEETE